MASRLADVDLVERLQLQIAALVAADDDRLEVNVKDLGRMTVGDPGADHLNVAWSGAFADATRALQEVDDRLRSAVGHRLLQVGDVAVNVELLAIESGYPDVHAAGIHAELGGNVAAGIGGCQTVHADRDTPRPDPTIGPDGLLTRPSGQGDFDHVGAVQAVFALRVSQVRRGVVVGE
jgi:hypothetical protein